MPRTTSGPFLRPRSSLLPLLPWFLAEWEMRRQSSQRSLWGLSCTWAAGDPTEEEDMKMDDHQPTAKHPWRAYSKKVITHKWSGDQFHGIFPRRQTRRWKSRNELEPTANSWRLWVRNLLAKGSFGIYTRWFQCIFEIEIRFIIKTIALSLVFYIFQIQTDPKDPKIFVASFLC